MGLALSSEPLGEEREVGPELDGASEGPHAPRALPSRQVELAFEPRAQSLLGPPPPRRKLEQLRDVSVRLGQRVPTEELEGSSTPAILERVLRKLEERGQDAHGFLAAPEQEQRLPSMQPKPRGLLTAAVFFDQPGLGPPSAAEELCDCIVRWWSSSDQHPERLQTQLRLQPREVRGHLDGERWTLG